MWGELALSPEKLEMWTKNKKGKIGILTNL
jgi:hypothetical protein